MSTYEMFVLVFILTMLGMFLIVFPLLYWIDWKYDVKKYGKKLPMRFGKDGGKT